jgi:glycosyltransferase involved in cell wall biosynthesis
VLVDYVRSRSLERSVTFTGVVDDVETYLHASDIFCLPSEREGMSNSLVEAMACGLACVAPASAGGDDLLADGAGLVPASNAANDLAASLTSLIADRELRLRLGRAAAARVQAHSLSAVIDAYEKLFEMVPTKRGRPAPLPQRTVH